MATAVIGGTSYTVPELNFAALERAWPFIEEAMLTQDPMAGTSAGLSIIAAGLVESEGFDPKAFKLEIENYDPEFHAEDAFAPVVKFLKRQLKSTEIGNVRSCVDDITREAGLEDASGEAPAAADQAEQLSLLAETAQSISPSSLPLDAKEAAGRA